MHQITGRWQLGLVLALTTAVMWGLLPVALKGVLNEMDATTITWFRFFISALAIGCYLQIQGGFPWRKLSERRVAMPMAIAIACLLCNFLLYLIGLDYTTAAAAQVLIQVAPILMVLLSLVVFKERFSPGQYTGLLFFGVGLVLFFNQRLGEVLAAEGRYVLGLLAIFAAAVVWAVYGILQKQLLRSLSSLEILWLIFAVGSIAFLPWVDFGSFLELSTLAWLCLVFAAVNTIVAYGTFAIALVHWEASRVSATITLVPIFTLIFVHLTNLVAPDFVVTEPMNSLSWLGASLVVLGSMAAALLKGR